MTGSGKKQDIGKKTEYTDILHTHTHPRSNTERLRKAIEKDTMTGLSEDTL